MRKWILAGILPALLLVILIEGLTFSTTFANNNVGVKEGISSPNRQAVVYLEPVFVDLSTITNKVDLLTLSDGFTELVGSFEVVTTQSGNGNEIVVALLSVSDTVTMSLHADDAGVPAQPPLTYTILVSGTYADFPLVIPEDIRTESDNLFWVQLAYSTTVLAQASVEFYWEAEQSSIYAFSIESPQIGDGSEILVDLLSVSDTVTMSLYADNTGVPASIPLVSLVIPTGTYENDNQIRLTIPEDSQSAENSLFWIQIFGPNDIMASKVVSVELEADQEGEPSSIDVFDVAAQQTGDGSQIVVNRLSATEIVTVSLYEDFYGVPDDLPITSTVFTETGTYENFPLIIPQGRRPLPTGRHPFPGEGRPLGDVHFWVQAFEKGSVRASKMLPVELQLVDEFRSDVITITTAQVGDGSKIMIDQLSTSKTVTVSLYTNDNDVPAQSAIVSKVLSGTHENLFLVIPEYERPLDDSIFWIQVYEADIVTPVEKIPVHLQLNDKKDRFVIDPYQIGDGRTITLTELVVFSKEIFVGVLGSNSIGEGMNPNNLLRQQRFPGPKRYRNIRVVIGTDERPTEDSLLWVRLYKTPNDPSSEGQKLQLVLRTMVTDFDVLPVQAGNGEGVSVGLISASKPVTLELQDDDQNIISESLLEGKPIYEDILLPIPLERRPKIDTSYLVYVYAGETTEPITEAVVLLDLTPVVDIDLSTRQVGKGLTMTLGYIQVSEPVQITLHGDSGGKPSEKELFTQRLEEPGIYENLHFSIPPAGKPKEDTVFWYQFVDAMGNEVFDPIPTTLIFEAGPPELTSSSIQVGIGAQVEITRLTTDIPIVVSLHADSDGPPDSKPISFIELRAGEYPDAFNPEVILSIPAEVRPVTDTVYWVHTSSLDRERAADPISVTLKLLPVISDIDVVSPQFGDGKMITIAKLDVTEQVTLTLNLDSNGEPGPRIFQESIEPGAHSNIVLELDKQYVADSTFWLSVYSRRQLEPHNSVTVTLDLPVLIGVDIDREQEGDGSSVRITRIAVSEPVTATLFEPNRSDTEPVSQQSFPHGIHEGIRLGISKDNKPVSDTLYILELTHNGGMTVTEPITVSLSVISDPTPKPVSEGKTSSILAKDQERAGFSALLDLVVTPNDAWVAVYEQQENGNQLVGVKRVSAGSTPNVLVYFNREVPRGAVLWAVMHEDSEILNQFDYPEADPPLLTNNEYVAESFVYGLPIIDVDSNQVVRRSIVVRDLISPQAGWLAIYDMAGKQLLGYKQVPAGRSGGLAVPFNVHVPPTGNVDLLAVLHQDNGLGNKAELPMPDSIRMTDGKIIAKALTVTIDPLTCGLTGFGYSFTGSEPFLMVDDPIMLDDHTLRIDDVCLPSDGWAVVYRDANGTLGDLIGYARIVGGNAPASLGIELTPPRPFGQAVWIVLHADMGQVGRLEISEPDLPISINGKPAVIYAKVGQQPLSGK